VNFDQTSEFATVPLTPEMREAVRVNPMRMLNRFLCKTCHYAWQQPAPTGTCPRCHTPDAKRYESLPCMAVRA
jgi:rubrerythrin